MIQKLSEQLSEKWMRPLTDCGHWVSYWLNNGLILCHSPRSPLSIIDSQSQSSTEHNITLYGKGFSTNGDYSAKRAVKEYLPILPSLVKMVSTDAVLSVSAPELEHSHQRVSESEPKGRAERKIVVDWHTLRSTIALFANPLPLILISYHFWPEKCCRTCIYNTFCAKLNTFWAQRLHTSWHWMITTTKDRTRMNTERLLKRKVLFAKHLFTRVECMNLMGI